MARPKFAVQHFMACLNAAWEGSPGPDTAHTLEGVTYAYGVPPDTEFPIRLEELWFYARLFLLNGVGGTRHFTVDTIWSDAPGGDRVVRSDTVTPVTFRPNHPVVNRPWVIRPVEFPGLGRYEFQLFCELRHWSGSRKQRVAREFIRIERRP
jgi:hypothetical protein